MYSLLNRLTGDSLSKKMIDIMNTKVNTIDVLIGVVDIIIDEACAKYDTIGFSTMCAKLCLVLADNSPDFVGKYRVKCVFIFCYLYLCFHFSNTYSVIIV